MGCDIHLWAERQDDAGTWQMVTPLAALRELVPTIDGQAVETVLRLGGPKAAPALPAGFQWGESYEGPLSVEHVLHELEDEAMPTLQGNAPEPGDGATEAEQEAYWAARDNQGMWFYHRRFYRGRNYWLFSRLCGVRNYNDRITPIAPPRGLPDDISAGLKYQSGQDGEDGHSHSWQTLAELQEEFTPDATLLALRGLDADPDGKRGAFDVFLQSLRLLGTLHPDPTKLRFVYWFDD